MYHMIYKKHRYQKNIITIFIMYNGMFTVVIYYLLSYTFTKQVDNKLF